MHKDLLIVDHILRSYGLEIDEQKGVEWHLQQLPPEMSEQVREHVHEVLHLVHTETEDQLLEGIHEMCAELDRLGSNITEADSRRLGFRSIGQYVPA